MNIIQSTIGHQLQKDAFQKALVHKRWPSAILFSGTQGIGKKRLALGMAQVLLCEKTNENFMACGSCGSCKRVESKQHESLLFIEPHSAPIKIEQSRDILSFFQLKSWSKANVVILDEVDMLTTQAANALLKIIEEPPDNSYIFLITHSITSILSTIKSRTQIWHFKPLNPSELSQIQRYPEWILQACLGSVARANGLLNPVDQEIRGQAFHFLQSVFSGNLESSLILAREFSKDKVAFQQGFVYILQWLRDCAVASVNPEQIIHKDYTNQILNFSNSYKEKIDLFYLLFSEAAEGFSKHLDMTLTIENLTYKLNQDIHMESLNGLD
jgi:DNA polymerase-3 subunit delta'